MKGITMKRRVTTGILATALAVSTSVAGVGMGVANALPTTVTDTVVKVSTGYRQDSRFTAGTGAVRAAPLVDTGTTCVQMLGPWKGKNLTSSSGSGVGIFQVNHQVM
jgi:hypothetical protein